MGKWPALDKIDMISGSLDSRSYEDQLKKLQNTLLDLQIEDLRRGGRCLIGFDGWDAAGKGGLIERAIYGLEPRSTHVWRIGAPSKEELAQHYLWRFWKRLPARGNWAIFDRTWYGRVLVERVEGFASKKQWKRAYEEIVGFERLLCTEGTVLVKFWLHVSKDEQVRRFHEREHDPLKRWKLTDEDWRNRDRRPDYERALAEMLRRTDHPHAPWSVIAAENKHYARVAVVKTVNAALEQGLRTAGIEPTTLGNDG
jgi:AMP-polyphosphate phosphotransferase